MKRIMFCAVICFVVLVFSVSAHAWTLVYAHDANGNATYGNVQTLVDAALAGKQIRFMFADPPYPTILDAQAVWVKGSTVYAQNTTLVGSSIDSANGDKLVFNAPGYYGFYNVSTQGIAILSRWRIGDHISEGENQYSVSLKWFVN